MDALLEGAFQLGRHDGDVLLVAENIAKRKTNELYVVLLNKLYDFAHGGVHKVIPPLRMEDFLQSEEWRVESEELV